MATRRDRREWESDSCESFHLESDTNDSGSETDISTPEPISFASRKDHCPDSRGIKRRWECASSPRTSRGPDNDGEHRFGRKRRAKLSSPLAKVRKRQIWPNEDSNASSSDSEAGSSGTDPEVETDDTSSDSEDDGYADGTKVQIARMRNRWERYCRKQQKKNHMSSNSKWDDPKIALRVAGKSELTSFLRWSLKIRRGKNGRRSKQVKKASTLDTNWKMFLRHYDQVNGDRMDEKLGRRMRKSIRKIVKQKGLDTEEKEKTPMFIEDLVPLQETVLRTMEKRFYIGLQRMQQCLYNLMACFTVNRINAMRKLQYKHLVCSIQRDPKGGPPRILLEITYKFAKKYLGVTQGNTFPIPEIIYDPSLMLSPHTFLLGILFHDDAFRAPGIQSMGDLRRLFLEGGRQQMEIPLKPEKADHYVFCKVTSTKGLVRFHRKEPITRGSLSSQIQTFGEITGFKWSLFTHRFRYGGGTIMNSSGLVSDAQQNLIMKHSDIRTFLKHYLPRRVGTDMQALMRGLEPDSAMMRAVTRMGRWIDTRRPRELTEEQKKSVECASEMQEAIQKRDRLAQKLKRQDKDSPKKLDRLDQLKRNVTNTRNRLLYDLRKRVRDEFDSEQAVIDIERQLAGSALHDEETKEMLRTEEHMLPQQIFLLEKLTTWPTSLSLEAEWRRRNEAVEAVRMYCDVREGGPRRGRRYTTQAPPIRRNPLKTDIPNPAPNLELSPHLPSNEPGEANDQVREATKPLGCFQCYGNLLEPEERRMRHYSRHAHLLRHFRAMHLDERHCHLCNVSVDDEMGLRRHAHERHGVKT